MQHPLPQPPLPLLYPNPPSHNDNHSAVATVPRNQPSVGQIQAGGRRPHSRIPSMGPELRGVVVLSAENFIFPSELSFALCPCALSLTLSLTLTLSHSVTHSLTLTLSLPMVGAHMMGSSTARCYIGHAQCAPNSTLFIQGLTTCLVRSARGSVTP